MAIAPDYKGHANLADMIKGHIAPIRNALQSRKHYSMMTLDHDDASYWAHEMAALNDIEAAVNAELNSK